MKKLVLFSLFLIIGITAKAQTEDAAQSGSKSYITAQDFVKSKLKYPKEAKFNDSYVHEKNGYRKCIILGKVTAKNAFGVKTEYVYKIWLEYKGGEWTSISNWKYSKMIIEDSSTGQQTVY